MHLYSPSTKETEQVLLLIGQISLTHISNLRKYSSIVYQNSILHLHLGTVSEASILFPLLLRYEPLSCYDICLSLTYFTQYWALQVRLCCYKWQDLILFHGCVISHIYFFIYRLLPYLIFVNNAAVNIGVHVSLFELVLFVCLLWINTQLWNCWII